MEQVLSFKETLPPYRRYKLRYDEQTIDGETRLAQIVGLLPDAGQEKLQSGTFATHATPGTVTSIDIPDWARIVIIRPTSNDVRFAINEDPEAEGASAFAVGAVARADTDTVRLLEAGESRTLRLRSTVASVSVYVEVAG